MNTILRKTGNYTKTLHYAHANPWAYWRVLRYTGDKTMKNYTIGEYLIVCEKLHNGAVSVSAIPDSGETIRRTFYGYTQKQLRAEISSMVRLGY